MIQSSRIKVLSKKEHHGDYIIYWMNNSQRVECNHALEYAIDLANETGKPLLVYFGLNSSYPESNERHLKFMLEGLAEVREQLKDRGIQLVIRHESPEQGIYSLCQLAETVVTDCGYTLFQREWHTRLLKQAECPVIQIESNIIVPVKIASNKEEYSAATLRPKLHRLLPEYLKPLEPRTVRHSSLDMDISGLDPYLLLADLPNLDIDHSVKAVTTFRGGTGEAKKYLEQFVNSKLDAYPECRNNPNLDCLSNMSPYLHFGQIAPLFVALEVLKTGHPAAEVYLEELIIRRELAINYVYYNPVYSSFSGLPEWARSSLSQHEKDGREYLYTLAELEQAQTHDPYWNAAQREMLITGKMHGYMRMYWGKKILEWMLSPEHAFNAALYLNNRYELDGRGPNGYTGVAWCFGKHDRPWAKRPVFGAVRYMNEHGLKRKFDADAYARKFGEKQ